MFFFSYFFFGSIFYAWIHAYLWCFSVLFKIVRPISGESSTKLPIWGHHTQIHRFYGIKRWNTMRKKISNFHKPRKKCSRHAHESIKPRLWQIRALEVGAEKIFLDVTFISKRALGGPPYISFTGIDTGIIYTGTCK